MNAEQMTPGERVQLRALVNARAKVEAEKVKVLIANRIVEADEELDRRFKLEDFQIKGIVKELQAQVDELNEKMAARCDEIGVHKSLRPSLHLSYYGGGFRSKDHRSELRREAKLKAEAAGKAMAAQIQAWRLDALTELTASGLSSDEAHAFLTAMPSAAALLPSTDDLIPQIRTSRVTRVLESAPADDDDETDDDEDDFAL